MALPACKRCGKTNPHKMFGLMTHWFGPFVDVPPDHGYFHLCPACYAKHVHPHLDAVQGKLAELHPVAARQLEQAENHGSTGERNAPLSAEERASAADRAARRSVHRERDPAPPTPAGGAGEEPAEA